MNDDKQAYAGIAQPASGSTEYDRMSFVARQLVNKMATTTLVEVVAVTINGQDATVDVRPLIAQLDGAGNATPHGIIHNIPVAKMQTGSCAILMIPTVGDKGKVDFCQSDISSVKKTRQAGNPGSRRKFDWADGIYMGALLNEAATTIIEMSPVGGLVIASPLPIKFVGDVEISGTLKVSGKDFATHVHSGITTGGANSGPVV